MTHAQPGAIVAAAGAVRARLSSSALAGATMAPKPGSRILVVEDDDFVRTSMVESLEALGHRVAQAADAEAGLRELRRERPDLMITDYLMPGMTGAELVQRARTDFPGLPMIIATGYADMRAIEQVIGEDVVLRKPFQLTELATSVEQALLRAAGSLPVGGAMAPG